MSVPVLRTLRARGTLSQAAVVRLCVEAVTGPGELLERVLDASFCRQAVRAERGGTTWLRSHSQDSRPAGPRSLPASLRSVAGAGRC